MRTDSFFLQASVQKNEKVQGKAKEDRFELISTIVALVGIILWAVTVFILLANSVNRVQVAEDCYATSICIYTDLAFVAFTVMAFLANYKPDSQTSFALRISYSAFFCIATLTLSVVNFVYASQPIAINALVVLAYLHGVEWAASALLWGWGLRREFLAQ